VKPSETLFVVDAMTGQDAVNTAKEFNDRLDFDGVVLTKLDGDTRGGAAISIRSVVSKPLKFISSGEKMDALQVFHPERMADRILGMGDVVSLVERAQEQFDEEEARRLKKKLVKNQFNFNDFIGQTSVCLNTSSGMSTFLSILPTPGSIPARSFRLPIFLICWICPMKSLKLNWFLKEARRLKKKLVKNQFNFNDFIGQIQQIKKMGNLKDLVGMLPGVGKMLKNVDIPDDVFKQTEAIISSIGPARRATTTTTTHDTDRPTDDDTTTTTTTTYDDDGRTDVPTYDVTYEGTTVRPTYRVRDRTTADRYDEQERRRTLRPNGPVPDVRHRNVTVTTTTTLTT